MLDAAIRAKPFADALHSIDPLSPKYLFFIIMSRKRARGEIVAIDPLLHRAFGIQYISSKSVRIIEKTLKIN